MTRALIIVDVQNDFCEGGSLGVRGGAAVAAGITAHLSADEFDVVVATKDHHVDPGDHFAAEPDYVHTWPAHCVVGTEGEQFHPALDISRVEAVFTKGRYSAAYSGFEGSAPDSEGAGEVGLAAWLRARAVHDVTVVGIATDHCVRATALDAVRAGFPTHVRLDLTAGVAEATTRTALAEMATAGVALDGSPWVGDGPLAH